MDIEINQEAALYILWQRTRYVKDHLLYKLSYRLNKEAPFLSRPFYNLLAFIKRNDIESQFSKDIEEDFRSIQKFLPTKAERILDIGACVGGINILLNSYFNNKIEIHLLDKSAVDRKIYYGFEDKTAFYNSLDVAKHLLVKNKVPIENIHI